MIFQNCYFSHCQVLYIGTDEKMLEGLDVLVLQEWLEPAGAE